MDINVDTKKNILTLEFPAWNSPVEQRTEAAKLLTYLQNSSQIGIDERAKKMLEQITLGLDVLVKTLG